MSVLQRNDFWSALKDGRMLSCLKTLPPASTNTYFSSPASQGHSVENTPRSSAQFSPTINLTEEFTHAVQTHSYGEIRRTFDQDSSFDQNVDIENVDFVEEPQLLEQVLQPSRVCIQEILSQIRPNSLTHLVATYFDHSEHTSRLCFLIYQSVRRARLIYTPIHNLLDSLPLEFDSNSYSLSHSQCTLANDAFLQFDRLENPFLSPDSPNFTDIRHSFSHLGQQLDHRLRKSKSRLRRYFSTGSALCLIAVTVGVVISAVVIASHAAVALVGTPICLTVFPSNMTKKEKVHLAQLDAASRNAYFLQKDLDTINSLVVHLHTDVENDKHLVHLGLERGMDRYLVQEILKQIQRNRPSFIDRLSYLEDHLFLCFAAINRTRLQLLQEINPHQNPG
ncbi:hypothetical protein CDL12_11228 [Handroanthus impetiginosus]|uniref:Uncharacterized protein n=1 Tax=Handroanthus impetiginosus TaxID=429701 RepID=A0A2G9HF02_9LAMI|nr:hypothetical protein CDL12_13188 [Handroanthus impetiginosus]PIN16119.1 hypothetical protein CDL12_11228 [Handroanthus impetiginosus]